MKEANKGKEPPEFISTHPSSDTRIKQLNEWQRELKTDLEGIQSLETDFDTIIIETTKRVNKLEKKVKQGSNISSDYDLSNNHLYSNFLY